MAKFDMPQLEVTSEIYSEQNYKTAKQPSNSKNVVSEFKFKYPQENNQVTKDEDGDLLVNRTKTGAIQIEHSMSTVLPLVGLQVWRGALLLADLCLHWGHAGRLSSSHVLELGAGTGLTSFVAGMYAKKVVCTDVDMGGILELIKENSKLNKDMMKADLEVLSLDFTKEFSPQIQRELQDVDLVFAADVIYDDTITVAFVDVLEKLLNSPPSKTILIALEKRYVFTLVDMDSVAPCYETFLTLLDKIKCKNLKHQWTIEQLPVDFPQYFSYQRVKELVLWQIKTGTFC